jgi:hypothetical protein
MTGRESEDGKLLHLVRVLSTEATEKKKGGRKIEGRLSTCGGKGRGRKSKRKRETMRGVYRVEASCYRRRRERGRVRGEG